MWSHIMHRTRILPILALAAFITNTAFAPATQTNPTLSSGWSNLAVVFLIIVVLAVLMITQANFTPQSVARYGLDQATQEHTEH